MQRPMQVGCQEGERGQRQAAGFSETTSHALTQRPSLHCPRRPPSQDPQAGQLSCS